METALGQDQTSINKEDSPPPTTRSPISPFPPLPLPKKEEETAAAAAPAPAPTAEGMAPNAPGYGTPIPPHPYGPYTGPVQQQQQQQQQQVQPSWPSPPYRAMPGWTPPFIARLNHSKPRPFRAIEFGAAFAVAIAADVALWARNGVEAGGFGLATLFVALPIALFVAARKWRGSVRLGAIAALLALVAGRCVYDPTVGTVLSGLGLTFGFVLALRARSMFVLDAAASWFAGLAKLPSRFGAVVRGAKVLASRQKRLKNVSILPIVIPVGLVLVFLGIFALANPVVAHGLDVGWTAISKVISLPSIGRIVFWLFLLGASVLLLRPALKLAKGSEAAVRAGEATSTALGIARNALVGLNVLFLGYNAIDARYLWTGAPPSGMHTQQYAHEGAFWLTVALLMLTAVIGVMFRGAIAHDEAKPAKMSRTLAYVWMAQGLVLGLGTYRRIAIHIAKSGLSDLRIVGILGTTLVLCGVVLVALKLRNAKTFTWLVRRQLDAFAITAVLYSVTPTHLLSANVNVARVSSGEYRPVLHSFRQSHEPESAAAYLPLLDHPDGRVRTGIAALLKDEHKQLHETASKQQSWRERDVATNSALAALDAAMPRIDAELGTVNPTDAKRVLLEISRAANNDRSLEELLAIPAALSADQNADTGSRRRGDL